MASVKLTKTELKKQKDQLKRYQRYLPTLQLKKQQLQLVIRKVEAQIREYREKQEQLTQSLMHWVAVFGENSSLPHAHRIEDLVRIGAIVKTRGNIAGVSIPVFEKLEYEHVEYDLMAYPLWVDAGIEALKNIAEYDAMITVLNEQIELLQKELRTTSQRVNLFEKVKIPEARENIRKVTIALGDQQTASVVRGKIAKGKLTKVS